MVVGDETSQRRMGDIDAELLEAVFHSSVELPLHRPAAGIGAFDLTDDGDHGAIDLVDPPQREIAAHHRPEPRILAHFDRDLFEHFARPVDILVIGEIDRDRGIADAAIGVGDAGHGTERDDVHRTVAGAKPDRSD